jgi:hypothetical protein
MARQFAVLPSHKPVRKGLNSAILINSIYPCCDFEYDNESPELSG